MRPRSVRSSSVSTRRHGSAGNRCGSSPVGGGKVVGGHHTLPVGRRRAVGERDAAAVHASARTRSSSAPWKSGGRRGKGRHRDDATGQRVLALGRCQRIRASAALRGRLERLVVELAVPAARPIVPISITCLGCLVGGEMRLDVVAERRFVERGAGHQFDERVDRLAPLLVGQADDGGVGDVGVQFQAPPPTSSG